ARVRRGHEPARLDPLRGLYRDDGPGSAGGVADCPRYYGLDLGGSAILRTIVPGALTERRVLEQRGGEGEAGGGSLDAGWGHLADHDQRAAPRSGDTRRARLRNGRAPR